jgi:hypothetical protein
LNSVWLAVVRLLQPAQLSLAVDPSAECGVHRNASSKRNAQTGKTDRVSPSCTGAPDDLCAATEPDGEEHHTSAGNASGHAEPDLRSPHTNVHLLEGVTVGRSSWTWHNANTSIV